MNLGAVLLLALAAPPAASLCTEGERQAMSCEVKSGKTVSLCLEGQLDQVVLRYRFGKPGAVELELPRGKTPAEKAWVGSWGYSGKRRTPEGRLETRNEGVTYEV